MCGTAMRGADALPGSKATSCAIDLRFAFLKPPKGLLPLVRRQIVHAFSRHGETAASMPVKDVMRSGVITVSPEESVNRVMKLMTRHRMRHMPVLRDGRARGYHQHR